MFNLPVDERLSEWINHRNQLDVSKDPLQDVWDFWHSAPFIPHLRNIDPYHQRSWPSPWEIIENNQYDDFTKALMICWTLKLTNKFKNSKIELRTFVDGARSRAYNIVYIDDSWVLNYDDNGPVGAVDVDDTLILENLIDVSSPR
jgi:uncharacterized membrane protein